MRDLSNRILGVAALALLSTSGYATLIDGFSDGDVVLSATDFAGQADLRAATVFSGSRATWLGQSTANPPRASHLYVAAGTFSVDNPVGTIGEASLGYGATSSATSGFMTYSTANDFTLGSTDAFVFHFLGNDQSLTVFVRSFSNGAEDVRYSRVVSGGQFTPFDVTIGAGDIVSGTPTWGNFDFLRVDFVTTNAGDFELDSFEAVPEPATVTALLLGLGALARRRRA